MSRSKKYLIEGRLGDVVMLLRYLGTVQKRQVYGSTISKELLVEPASPGATWTTVAEDHPEFFRVSGETDNKAIMLLWRYGDADGHADNKAAQAVVESSIDLALRLHERQIALADKWHVYLPLISAAIAGVFTLIATMLARWPG